MMRDRILRVEPIKGDPAHFNVVFAAERVSTIRTIHRVEDVETGDVIEEKIQTREDTVCGFGETVKLTGAIPRTPEGGVDVDKIKTSLTNHAEYAATLTLLRAKAQAWKPPEQQPGPEEIPADRGILS